MLQCHPDKVQDESLRAQKQDEFQKVQQAYEILSDDSRRQRYDDLVKRAELRREVLERGGGRGAAHYESPSGGTGAPVYEMRAGRMYEERVPNRSFEDDIMSSRYEQPRASARKYESYEGSSRRSSVREQEERRRARAAEDERERVRVAKERARGMEKSGHYDRQRTREKDRKRGYDDKYSRRSYTQDGSDSDSGSGSGSDSDDTKVYSSKQGGAGGKRHEEVRRRERGNSDLPRRTRSQRDQDDIDDWERSLNNARDYIEKSRGPVEAGVRPTMHRSATSIPYVEPRSSNPPPPPRIDTGRRGSGRPRERVRERSRARSSGRERKDSVETVEPLGRLYETRKMPSMPTSSSSPANIKVPLNPRGAPHRSSTMQHIRSSKYDTPGIRRSETTPLAGMTSRRGDSARGDSARGKSSTKNLETHDSGYSSPGTPETQYVAASPQPRSTKYQIVDDDGEDFTRGHRTILVDPDKDYRRHRSVSPHSRRTPERPTLSTRGATSTRHVPAGRGSSYAFSPDSPQSSRQGPSLSRTESSHAPPALNRATTSRDTTSSSRSKGQLFGEIPEEDIRWSPRIEAKDIRYSNHGRSKGQESSGRDAYPRSQYPEAHRHPGMTRQESYAY